MLKKIANHLTFVIWKNVHKFPKELIDVWQLIELKKIIKHAYSNTKLYKDLYDNRKVNYNNLKKISDLENFPIINKEDFILTLKKNYLYINKYKNYIQKYTSGSTGMPFLIITTRTESYLHYTSLTYRPLLWKGFSIEKINETPIINLDINHTDDNTYTYRKNFSANNLKINTEETLKEIFEFNPVIIDSFPSFLIDFTNDIIKFPKYKNPDLKYIFSRGENLTLSQRKFIEKNLQCEIFDRYGMEEFGAIGVECKYHNGFHINNESFLVEIVDKKGKLVNTSKMGTVLITDLRNYVMPFIRYNTGDRGCFIKEKCKCGIFGKRLVINGRNAEFLYFKKHKIHYFEFYDIMKFYSDTILQYQIKKINKKKVVLYIVLIKEITSHSINLIRKKIENLISNECALHIEIVSSIKKNKRGKTRTIINL